MASAVVERSLELIFSSDPVAGAVNIRENGSYFEVQFVEPLHIPAEATNVKLQVVDATIWWTVPNVEPGVNDQFTFDMNGLGNQTFSVPKGLYDLNALQAALRTIMTNNGVPVAYANQNFQLIADAATQKVLIYLAMADSISVGDPNSVFQLAGWPTGSAPVVGPGTTSAPNIAEFNQIGSFFLHSDLINRGLRLNNQWNQIIAQVLIDVPPGSQITFQPFNPPISSAAELVGAHVSNARFWLTDDKNRPVDTFGEFFTLRVKIDFTVPLFIH